MLEYNTILDTPEEYADLLHELNEMQKRLNEIAREAGAIRFEGGREGVWTLDGIDQIQEFLSMHLKAKLLADFMAKRDEIKAKP